ncbi:DUF692 domain-containing protein [Altererythrobacter sp. ZODW24]|uniref:MNIO family bufferin maturase n=1 Tax=Altererythrobacter sp. ZODW24 TaxID=2185142 RepID=UPI000DF727C4|nr:DUF692 domain-containing protein [Altererythrobacter sp. ZODW24]
MTSIPSSSSAAFARPLPPKAGVGLKPQHYSEVLEDGGDATNSQKLPGWVEVHPQNYFADGGPALRWLTALAEQYPVSFHSTGISLGSAEGPDMAEVDRLKRLMDHVEPAMVSDHLSWSQTGNHNFPDLLPLPYDEPTLDHFARAVEQVQNRLGRTMLVENPSRYLAFAGDTMSEVEFLTQLCQRTGCGLLFDINNVLVSATNLDTDPGEVIDAIDPALVGEIHLAGHATEDHGDFTMAIDDHGSAVADATWALYDRFVARAGPKPTLIEWDTDVPDYSVLAGEMAKAEAVLLQHTGSHVVAA